MKSKKIHHTIIPHSEVRSNTLHMYYQVKPGNEKKHIRMHPQDEQYIIHWLTRFTVDCAQKQFLDKELFRMVTKSEYKELMRSGVDRKTPNSLLSAAAGLVSNQYRNPSEDFTQKQLKWITKLFSVIHFAYSEGGVFTDQDLGYDFNTNKINERPLGVKFTEV